ncbi:flagellar biosynthesis protein FlhB [Alphaproteobacteria bacterium]|nr:flagellar biosynthesis protein FlhB [Alphaproteobacteria bacterium]
MAEESSDGQEKTEDPSERKLEKAREDGQVLSSKEAFVFTTLAMAVVLLMGMSSVSSAGLTHWGTLFRWDHADHVDTLAFGKLVQSFWMIIIISMVIGVPMMIVTLFTQLAVGGVNFAPKSMAFKANRIDPIAGLKRMFSAKSLVELGKSILKVVLLFGVAGLVIYVQLPSILRLSEGTLNGAMSKMNDVFPVLLGAMLIVLFIIAAIDYSWQSYSHNKKLKMSRQEQKDEHKQTEGSPEVKAKIRRMQMEQSQASSQQRESLENVADATAIITNPTHFAVALKYVAGEAGAPVVLAMGKGRIAEQIIERANDSSITIMRSPLLARALFFTSEIGGEISEKLYNAVAIALAYIYRIDNGETLGMPDIDLPEDLRFDENGKTSKDVE